MTASPEWTERARPDALNARSLLLPYVVVLVALCVVLQIAIVLAGNRIGFVATVGLGLVYVFYSVYLVARRERLRQIRFAPLVAHAVTYAVVNGSFQLHAAILAFVNSDSLRGDEYLPIDAGWLGPTLAMAGFWSIGLAVHAIASIAQRGYEN